MVAVALYIQILVLIAEPEKKNLLIKIKKNSTWLLAIILEKNPKFYVYIIDAYWIYKFYNNKKNVLLAKGQF